MDRRAWWATVHGVTNSWIRPSDWHFHLKFWASVVTQMVKNPPTMWETGVQSVGWEDPLEKDQPPTPVLLSGEFHGQRRLAGYSPWGHKESDTTEWLSLSGPLSSIYGNTHSVLSLITVSSWVSYPVAQFRDLRIPWSLSLSCPSIAHHIPSTLTPKCI